MRILLLPNTYVPVLGGVQTVTHILAQHLLSSGHKVQVVTNRYPRSLATHETLDGVSIYRLLLLSPDTSSLLRRRPDLFLASLYFYPRSLWRLRKLMRSFRPDVVNVHFPDHQIRFVLALRRRFEFRLVVSLHGHDVERFQVSNTSNHSATKKKLQLILREADAVTACSQHLLNQAVQIESSIANKGQVIHNGIDPQRFVDKSSYVHPRPYAFAFGRLTHKKGFDILLEAFAQARSAVQEIDLLIAGEGEEHDALALRAQQLGLQSSIHFLGRATQAEVVRLLNGSLFVVVPSRCEPFGIAALEALAAGKPVLATKVGGLAEFLTEFNDGNAITLVDPEAEKLATGLRQMFELPRNHSREIRDYQIADKYSWEHVTRRYENVLLERCQS